MTDAMEVLLQYAEEHMVHALMVQDPQYLGIRSHVQRQEEAFLSLLTKETAERFENLIAERSKLDFIYEQTLFCAGFQIALELAR